MDFAGKAYTLTADIDVPTSEANGVIFSQGSRYGGTTLYVEDNYMIYEINAYGNRSGQLKSSDVLSPGRSHIVLELTPEPNNSRETLGSPVSPEYQSPDRFTGKIEAVTIQLKK